MFAGFNLEITENSKINFGLYKELGKNHLGNQKAEFKKKMEDYLVNGIVNGTQIEKDWFPLIEADIFISHSHADEALANGIAGWLNTQFGLKCFVDSCVWSYSDDLLEMINSSFSNKREDTNGGYLYDHQKCNTASKHVNIMLSVALQKMIDKTEATILLNTTNSISRYSNVYEDATYSPWIYSEIVCTQIVRRKPLSKYRKEGVILEHASEGVQMRYDSNEFKAAYEITLDHLIALDENSLLMWENIVNSKEFCYPLDYLYRITNPDKMWTLGNRL